MFSYIHDLKTPDLELINLAYNDVKKTPIHEFEYYKLYFCNFKIRNFLKNLFPSNYKFGVQRIFNGQEIHIDHKRKVVYNYIIEPGGDNVYTCFWSDLEGSSLVGKFKIEPFKWTKLDVTIPHSVQNISTERIAITAWEPTE